MTVPYAEQLACVERELKWRQRVYPRRVADGRMTQAKAIEEVRTMEAVADTLRGLASQERLL
jgi:hypothetical protein